MLTPINIVHTDAKYNTNAPFEWNCPLVLNSIKISSEYFRSVKIYCDKTNVLPVHLDTITISIEDSNICYVSFCDANGIEIGKWRACVSTDSDTNSEYCTAFIRNTHNEIKGHISFHTSLPGALLNCARKSNGTVTADYGDFVLLPHCHVAWHPGHGRTITINDYTTLQNVKIHPGILTRIDSNLNANGDNLSISVVGPYKDKSQKNGICNLVADNVIYVNGSETTAASLVRNPIWLGGKHLVIRSSITSNIRVLCDGQSIYLAGVTK